MVDLPEVDLPEIEGPGFGEGFWVTVILIAGFVVMASTFMATGAKLEALQGVAILAGAFGINGIIMFWFQSRGQTSQPPP